MLYAQMTDMNDFNTKIIEEFRANAGTVGGPFEGAPMVLVHHRGAKTGTERVAPLVYQRVGDDVVVFGSKGGAPSHPQWYLNLVANPETTIEVGTETIPVRAEVITGEERDRLYARQAADRPAFAEYQAKTKRRIPVIALTRRAG
jgi:deazaflavin-dependent oxidoreductase (nitroreductase family)